MIILENKFAGGTMKRKITVWLLIVMILLSNVTFANKFFENDTIELYDTATGETGEYKVVNLVLGGEDVLPDIPGILYVHEGETRTLVPISFITDAMGLDIYWDGDEKSATISTPTKDIKLIIESKTAYVDGEAYQLPSDVPAKLMAYEGTYRTMVPVRFVSEQLGMEISWVEENRAVVINKPSQTISEVNFDYCKKFPELQLKVTGELDYTDYLIEGSNVGEEDKIIIDFQNAIFEPTQSDLISNGMLTYDIDLFNVKAARVSQFDTNPYITRLVIDLDDTKGYEIEYDESRSMMVVRFINAVEDIGVEAIYSADTVVVKTNESPIYNVDYLSNKIIVDVINASLDFNEGSYKKVFYNSDTIKSYSFSQLDPTGIEMYEDDDVISRVVVELAEGASMEDVFIEDVDENIMVYVSGDPLRGFDYVKESQESASLDINFTQAGNYSTDYNRSKKLLTVTIPKASIELSDLDIAIDDHIIDEIEIDAKSNPDNYIINLAFAKGTVYSDYTSGTTTSKVQLVFVNEDIANSKYKDMIVVIDPGHGGKDSGAVGSKAYEKDIALSASLMIKKKLESQGFKVYMTREKDEYIGLYDRANIANDLNATAFVSVHINAHNKDTAKGVEVLYAPDPARDSFTLARNVQNNLVSYLNAVDRGVVERPNLVVIRETHMPAILAELGFISNAEDQEKLLQTSYLDSAAQAVVDGLMKTLK